MGDVVIAGGLVLAIGEVARLVVVGYGYRLIRWTLFSRLREGGLKLAIGDSTLEH